MTITKLNKELKSNLVRLFKLCGDIYEDNIHISNTIDIEPYNYKETKNDILIYSLTNSNIEIPIHPIEIDEHINFLKELIKWEKTPSVEIKCYIDCAIQKEYTDNISNYSNNIFDLFINNKSRLVHLDNIRKTLSPCIVRKDTYNYSQLKREITEILNQQIKEHEIEQLSETYLKECLERGIIKHITQIHFIISNIS